MPAQPPPLLRLIRSFRQKGRLQFQWRRFSRCRLQQEGAFRDDRADPLLGAPREIIGLAVLEGQTH